jgi:uncharacterized protein YbjT (DUF2867 family)
VYFSVFNSEAFTDVPHFTGKYTVERMLRQYNMPATILRPSYFMQNDVSLKDALLEHGVYPMPLGAIGVSMVDTRDIAELAASALLKRENASEPLPQEVIEVVGPQALTGTDVASIWSDVLGTTIQYAGDDLDAFETRFNAFAPGWMARDMRLMFGRFQKDGMAASASQLQGMTALLGRSPRSYKDFASETAKSWKAASGAH